MTLGDTIRDHRNMLGLSQEQVANVLGTTGATVGRWERDERTPYPRHLAALAKLYRTDVQALVRPVRPAYARELRSKTQREVLADNMASGESVCGERDPFGWRLNQLLDQRELDRWAFATRLGVHTKTVTGWLAHESTPLWPALWRAADLLDVPVWWWRCGGYDEMASTDRLSFAAMQTGRQMRHTAGSSRTRKPPRSACPSRTSCALPTRHGPAGAGNAALASGHCRRSRIAPVSARLRLAVAARCNETGENLEDTIAWITVVCEVKDLTVWRWLRGERVPRWEHACGVALALAIPAWSLWMPVAELAVVEHATV